MLDEANDDARMQAKKRALETVSSSCKERYQQTVVSSADGAKVLKNLDKLVRDYEENEKTLEKTFIGTVANALGAERLREEHAKILKGNGGVFEKVKAVNAIKRVREALKRFWKNVADWFGIHFTTAEEVADKVFADLLNGVNPTLAGIDNDIRFEENSEEAEIVARAKADGTYMKAPNGKQSNLSPRQWVQVRTKAFKDWFGDWEKAARIEKLRNSNEVDVKYHGEYSLTAKDAQEWIKENLRGEYKINDTNEIV